MRVSSRLLPIVAAFAFLGCSGEKRPASEPAVPPVAGAPSLTPLTPCATCKVIEVTMQSTDKGNYFTPSDIKATKGDILRFKLVIGVHNVNFLPDSNPGKTGLPVAGALLQLPGQTADVLLSFGEGKFYFQCDPHAALGMKGHVTVGHSAP